MSDPQTHIVYRNRAEHDFYESGMMIPLIGGLGVGFLLFLGLMAIIQMPRRGFHGPSNFAVGVAAVISLIAGGAAFHFLML